MNQFLKNCRSLLTQQVSRIVVIGNESCDLDSAVCSICLAFHLSKCPSLFNSFRNYHFIPVLNVSRKDLPLKTEVVFYLHENNISIRDLICNDEIELPEAMSNETKLILVDHHLSKYRQNVIGVIDHRPFDSYSNLNENVYKHIELVGSCASLVLRIIDQSNVLKKNKADYISTLNLLYDYVKLEDAEINLQKFARMTGANVIVLIGMRMDLAKNDNANMRRDLGIINVNNQDLFQKILKELTSNNTVDLCLEKNNEIEFLGGAFYDQRNVVYTRKQILPLICDIMDKF
ncbi:exopolyphosphatase PRUNE1 isoform X2 [Malaya genurostris]|uniref:exopolyphosphatase PRUNE1 isoform X2 n=1 Tax=Malaya genurostris TaxID=325434 RepID=UPI0026F3907E|nr:exopolyphosphatase PRUNE1 isoform X2 [Malaya genurostris]